MSKIVEVTDDLVYVQSKSGKEKAFDRRDVLYPDPRVDDEVVVYKDEDGYPVVQLKEYYEEDHPKQALQPSSSAPYHNNQTTSGKAPSKANSSFFSSNKFGIIGIIVGFLGLFHVIIAIIGLIISIIGVVKDKKRVFGIIGITLSCLMLVFGLGGSSSTNTSSDISANTETASYIHGTNRDDWTDPEFGSSQIFGRMYYSDISNWYKNDDTDAITYYPYGSSDPTGLLYMQKFVNEQKSTDVAYSELLTELGNIDGTSIQSQDTATVGNTEYMHVLLTNNSVESDAYIYADSGYVYMVAAMENPELSPNMYSAVQAFLENITYDPAGDVPLYADDRVTISYKASAENAMYFTVQNLTDSSITLHAVSLSANGQTISDVSMSSEIAAQSTGMAAASCTLPDSWEVSTVAGLLVITSSGFDAYSAGFGTVPVLGNVPDTALYGPDNQDAVYMNGSSSASSEASSDTAEETKTDTLLYQDDRVNIYYSSVDSEGVSFKVQNKTDLNLTFQADSVSVNGISYNDIIMSDDVAPQSTGIIKAKCSVDVPDKVETIGGQLTVFDYNRTFDIYKATFSNIAIQ